MRSLQIIVLMTLLSASFADGAQYFVSPKGLDTGSGNINSPFATIGKASSVMKPGDTCFIRKGIYREVLRPKKSGEPGKAIAYSNYRGERVIISGADLISGWQSEEIGIYSAAMDWTIANGNQIFANGKMLNEACWPNAGEEHLFKPKRGITVKGTPNTLKCASIPGKKDLWKGAQLWCAGGAGWICWSSTVTGYNEKTHTLTFDKTRDKWYTPKKGSLFSLRGMLHALDAPGEWFYESGKKKLWVIPPKSTDIRKINIEAKRRGECIDLGGRSYININGIEFRAGGIRTDKNSSHIILKGLKGSYVSHSYHKDVSYSYGVLIIGNNILVLNCDFGYSSASVLTVRGSDNRIINCNIHHGGYAGLWRGTVALSGRRIVFSHNTVKHAGRDLINTHGLMESLIQYNDVSEAGWLTSDLGMFYGHNTDFANTEFRYNLVHDNHAKHCSMGIYFDHLSHNAIVHHNVIWNVSMDPLRFNNPSYCNLVFNNTCWNAGYVRTFDHSKRNDLFETRYFNNIVEKIDLPDHVMLENNLFTKTPEFRNTDTGDFRLKASPKPNLGAYQLGGKLWKAGCDLKNPPSPLPVYKAPRIKWMNTVRNACFEFGTLEGWEKTDALKAVLIKGNGWGNGMVGGKKGDKHATGTSKFELKLGPGVDGVRQTVKKLIPGKKYRLSAWLRVSGKNETVTLGVKNYGGKNIKISSSSPEWTRKSIEFTTDPKSSEATIYLLKSSKGSGSAWCDNITLPL